MSTVSQVFYIETIGMNAFQLVLVGMTLELSCFIFEIPTGIVADRTSRKRSIVIGLSLMGMGFLLEGLWPFFYSVLVAQLIWGLGITFISGADDAWIADEWQKEHLSSVYLRGAQVAQGGALIGIGISIMLAQLSYALPIILSGISFLILAMFLTACMPEQHFHPLANHGLTSWNKWVGIAIAGFKYIRKSYMLWVALFVALLQGLYSEGFDRLWTLHFLQQFTLPEIGSLDPVVWFGILNGGAMVLNIIVVEWIRRRVEKSGNLEYVWILALINLFLMAAIVFFAFTSHFMLAIMTYWLVFILRGTNAPLFRAWINSQIKSSQVRATVMSTVGQVDALGQIGGGPILGWIALKSSVGLSIMSSSVILAPVVLLYVLIGINNGRK
ncbi:MFS transporter [Mechercharimyces sp. CAU 1602]|uniref:MFS transporter n=1 Tax=Mechercharimyces sp. CAU 1602 TaxID=2973933 RepID=UPI002161D88C|nr:MFS transporter [Mechercharimyces sp. CAU 1602]MCS1352278.1 MFS transporter [Mechercharimyces sp. CAU 1602]